MRSHAKRACIRMVKSPPLCRKWQSCPEKEAGWKYVNIRTGKSPYRSIGWNRRGKPKLPEKMPGLITRKAVFGQAGRWTPGF